jgi:phage terminase large subunit GpA-like protein
MKNKIKIIIFAVCILSAQTAEQIKQAKEVIKNTGMSEAGTRAEAKAQGYSDKQIDAAIQKEKDAKTTTAQITSESTDKTGLPELGKSNTNTSRPVLHFSRESL